MNNNKIFTFIYFDLGGVAIRDFSGTSHWNDLKNELGIKPEDSEKFDEFFDKYEDEICTTRSVDTLVPLIEKEFDVKLPKNYSFLQAFVDRFEKNESIWPIVKKAKEKYRIGLLTNVYPGMLGLIKKRSLLPPTPFEVEVDSSMEKLCKPYKEMFDVAQRKAGVNASEILFIDNSKRHTKAAKKFDWQTFLYDSSNIEKSNAELEKII